MSEDFGVDLAGVLSSGDDAGWRALIARHGPVVWAVARAFRLNDCDADDVFQATWLNAAERFWQLRNPEKISAWLGSIAKRECLRVIHLRRPLPVQWQPDDYVEPADDRLLRAERHRELWAAFRTLPDRCQRLLRLYAYVPDFSYRQLAEAIGIRPGSVGSTKGRCLKALKLKLDRDLFDQLDPMPAVIAIPQRPRERFETRPERATRNASATLSFTYLSRTVQIQLGTTLTGIVVPAAGVQIWWPNGMTTAQVDDYGLFTADPPPGPVRLVIDDVVTEWFVR